MTTRDDKKPQLTPECRLGECQWCRSGDVFTSYGDLALHRRCDHKCHRRKGSK